MYRYVYMGGLTVDDAPRDVARVVAGRQLELPEHVARLVVEVHRDLETVRFQGDASPKRCDIVCVSQFLCVYNTYNTCSREPSRVGVL